MLDTIWHAISRLFVTMDRPSPQDTVPRGNISVVDLYKVVINLEQIRIPFRHPPLVWVGSLADTKSMDPVMDSEHNTILLYPNGPDDHQILCDYLRPGDIAVWRRDENTTVIHRVTRISRHNGRRRFHFRGDNNGADDAYIIQDEHIVCICAGIIY